MLDGSNRIVFGLDINVVFGLDINVVFGLDINVVFRLDINVVFRLDINVVFGRGQQCVFFSCRLEVKRRIWHFARGFGEIIEQIDDEVPRCRRKSNFDFFAAHSFDFLISCRVTAFGGASNSTQARSTDTAQFPAASSSYRQVARPGRRDLTLRLRLGRHSCF